MLLKDRIPPLVAKPRQPPATTTLTRKLMSAALHHTARPSQSWLKISHRFPEVGPDAHHGAKIVTDHVITTMIALFGDLDRIKTDLHLSPEGRDAQIKRAGQTALAELQKTENETSMPGVGLGNLRRAWSEADQRATAKAAVPADRLPYVTAVMTALSRLDRSAAQRALATSAAAVADLIRPMGPSDAHIATCQAFLMTPEWFWTPSLSDDLTSEIDTALRTRLAEAEHRTAADLAGQVEHVERLIQQGYSELKHAGIVVPNPHLKTTEQVEPVA